MGSNGGKVIVGQIVHFLGPSRLQVLSEGFVIVSELGKILAIGNASDLKSTEERLNFSRQELITLSKTQVLLPGLVDSHIHAPQYPNAGLGYDRPLLEWLEKYTYNLEKKYKDAEMSRNVYRAVVRKTLDHGTTTACYFGSLFADSTLILVEAITEFGQRALVGKVNMIRLAPADYLETAEKSVSETLRFIEEVKKAKNPLVLPVITPRFALSVDSDLMQKLAEIAQEQDLHIQTHISENRDELKMVEDMFKDTYANVYDKANLLTPKTILAHGIYLSDLELDVLKRSGTSISHCPESNTNLGSGLCDVVRLLQKGIDVGLGTDVSGGASPSILGAMRAAIGVSTHISFGKENYTPLNYKDVLYLATLGGAKALALEDQIGNFEVGKCFDAIIADVDVMNSSADYLDNCSTVEELLQKLVFLGDDRNVVQVFVNGRRVK